VVSLPSGLGDQPRCDRRVGYWIIEKSHQCFSGA
jgi:hypothetical protein